MKTTREEILAHLEHSGPITSAELARRLNRTPADIRYHIGRLRSAGLLATLPPAAGAAARGRPRPLYQLSAKRDHPHDRLLAALLTLDSVMQESDLDRRLSELGAMLGPIIPIKHSLPVRLNAVVEGMTSIGYRIRWEAYQSGPRIRILSSPFSSLFRQYPQMASLDRMILRKALDPDLTVEPLPSTSGSQIFRVIEKSIDPD